MSTGRPDIRGKRAPPKPPTVPGGDEEHFGGFGDDAAGGRQTYENLTPPALGQPFAPRPGGKVSILAANIIREKQIGEGEFGEVCQGIWLHDGQREVRIVPCTCVVSHLMPPNQPRPRAMLWCVLGQPGWVGPC